MKNKQAMQKKNEVWMEEDVGQEMEEDAVEECYRWMLEANEFMKKMLNGNRRR